MSSFGQDFDSQQPATNPAEPYMSLLEKYLPGVQFVARPCWCMYSFDPQQLARLLEHVEETIKAENGVTYRHYSPYVSGHYVDLPASE